MTEDRFASPLRHVILDVAAPSKDEGPMTPYEEGFPEPHAWIHFYHGFAIYGPFEAEIMVLLGIPWIRTRKRFFGHFRVSMGL